MCNLINIGPKETSYTSLFDDLIGLQKTGRYRKTFGERPVFEDHPEIFSGKITAFTRPFMPILVLSEDKLFWDLGRWRLVPSDVTDEARFTAETVNARYESIATTKSYAGPFERRAFAFVPMAGFFEWMHINDEGEPDRLSKKTKRYYISLADNQVMFAMAVYSDWNRMRTFSIITTQANKLMSHIHNVKQRQPAILSLKELEEIASGRDFTELLQVRDEIPLIASESPDTSLRKKAPDDTPSLF